MASSSGGHDGTEGHNHNLSSFGRGCLFFVMSEGCEVQFNPVQFSPLTDWVVRVHEGRFSRDPLSVFPAGGDRDQPWHGQGRPLSDAAHPVFSLPTTALPNLQGALKDGFGEAVLALSLIHI